MDNVKQPRYPFPFIQADALEHLAKHGHEYDFIHASPPCQGYSRMRHLPWLAGREYPMLIPPTRELLLASGKPWVIENVEGAPIEGVMLCGTMFDLKVYRHRIFESSVKLHQPHHEKHRVVIGKRRSLNARAKGNDEGWVSTFRGTKRNGLRNEEGGMITVAGNFSGQDAAKQAMGIDWMNRYEISQAIPPRYTWYIGVQIVDALEGK